MHGTRQHSSSADETHLMGYQFLGLLSPIDRAARGLMGGLSLAFGLALIGMVLFPQATLGYYVEDPLLKEDLGQNLPWWAALVGFVPLLMSWHWLRQAIQVGPEKPEKVCLVKLSPEGIECYPSEAWNLEGEEKAFIRWEDLNTRPYETELDNAHYLCFALQKGHQSQVPGGQNFLRVWPAFRVDGWSGRMETLLQELYRSTPTERVQLIKEIQEKARREAIPGPH